MPLCYDYGLVTILLLYKNAPGLIWGYNYIYFSFSLVLSSLLKGLDSCMVQEISMVDRRTSEVVTAKMMTP